MAETITVKVTRLGGTTVDLPVDLDMIASNFIEMIAERFEIDPASSVKAVCKGRMIKHTMTNKTFRDLRVKEGDKIIVMNKPTRRQRPASPAPPVASATESKQDEDVTMAEPEPEVDPVLKELERQKKFQEIREAAEKLAARSNDGFGDHAQYYMELRNQNGEVVQLPERDRQALTMGLTLHEKGKALMKRKEYDEALHICTLAFESFQQCDPQWLNLIDNVGFLALDIVWMYYLKQDQQELTNAHRWLMVAEEGLKKAHGERMERLTAVRGGGFKPEIALYVRLKILRSLLAFYSEDMNNARNQLHLAEMDLRKLQVDPERITQLIAMGFTDTEARRALRATDSNMDMAVGFAAQKREERRVRELEEQERLRQRRRARALGRTSNGEFVNLKMLDGLRNIGVAKEIAVEALKQTNNHEAQTFDLVLSPAKKAILETAVYRRCLQPSNKVDQLTSMGFSNFRVRSFLELNNYSVASAIEFFMGTSFDSFGTEQDLLDLELLETRLIDEQAKVLSAALAQTAFSPAEATTSSDIENIVVPSATAFPGLGDAPLQNDPEAVFDINSLNVNQNEEDVPQDVTSDVSMTEAVDDGAATEDVDVPDAEDDEKAALEEMERQRTDDQIQEHLIEDMEEAVEDPEAYLDLDLQDEEDAIRRLKAMFASVSGRA